MAYDRLQTMRDNIEALRTAFRLEAEHRAPDETELQVLRRYAGFGGLKCILNDADELADAAKWNEADKELFAPTMELRRLIHDYSKNDKEFAAYMDSLKASTMTAFYTPKPVIDALADSLNHSGVKIGKFLEPSAGQGAFVDSFMHANPGAEILAFEKDLLTGKILDALHPAITTGISGFEKIDPDFEGYFDVAASNIPFGDFAVADPRYATSKEIAYRQCTKAIHNYFFLKSLDSVREGGLVAFIAPQQVMNSASPFIRMEMMRRADLVGAIRLPNNTFADAGSDMGCDLIILQKHTGKKSLSVDEEFFIQSIVDRETQAPNNKYYAAYPQNIICTEAKIGTDTYGRPSIVYHHAGGIEGIADDMRKALDETIHLRFSHEHYINPPMSEINKTQQKSEPPKEEKVFEANGKKFELADKVTPKNEPLLQQYREMKKKHTDAVLLFRVGDFYETFSQDAIAVSEILGITLTRRANGKGNYVELAGFPHHALDTYLPKLVRAGKRVAVCEQLADPKQRQKEEYKPTEIITPQEKAAQQPAPSPVEPSEPVKLSDHEVKESEKNLAAAGQSEDNHGYEVGEKVWYTRATGNQEPELATIVAFGGDSDVTLDTGLAPVMYEACEWSQIQKYEAPKYELGKQEMTTVNGDRIHNAEIFQWSDHTDLCFLKAEMNGTKLRAVPVSQADVEAITSGKMPFAKAVEKYYPSKILPRYTIEQLKAPTTIIADDGHSIKVEYFFAFKDKHPENKTFGEYLFCAQVDGKKMVAAGTREDLEKYFDKVELSDKMVARIFGDRLHLKVHYEQFSLPMHTLKDAEIHLEQPEGNAKAKISVRFKDGRETATRLVSDHDYISLTRDKVATREQLAAKYLYADIKTLRAQAPKASKQQGLKF